VQRTKQLLKNGVYRAIGEASRLVPRNGDTTLRVLMYHKVNDRPGNPLTVPTGLFEEQLALLGDLGYRVVGLDAVLDHYVAGAPLPERAVLITFDDGYRDTLEHAAPALARHGYPAVVFVPTAFLDGGEPLPHERGLAARGLVNPTVGAGQLAELEAAGVRVESHGVSHRSLAALAPEEAAGEVADSKARLEELLGRPIRAYAFAKGSRADYRPEDVARVRAAGYDLAFTTVSGGNGPDADRFELRRCNVEPYPARTFELVLSGACDVIALKDTVAGTRAKRVLNAALRTR
jgi:peptidoglycan/xylan/chitin deacetylase (PgdA/CDA1 family)